jgi:hypothetical protein
MFALELEITTLKLIILSLHRTPTGDFNQFIKIPYDALEHLYNSKQNF